MILYNLDNTELEQGLTAIRGFVNDWALPLAAIGTLSMALVQTAKNLLPLREQFQRRFVQNWIVRAALSYHRENLKKKDANGVPDGTRMDAAKAEEDLIKLSASGDGAAFYSLEAEKKKDANGVPDGTRMDASRAEEDLIKLSASGDGAAFYSLEADKMCTQIRNATLVLLDYPKMHEDLLYCLGSQAELSDFKEVLSPPDHALLSRLPHQHTEEEKKRIKEYAAAKSRIAAQMRCNIDAIQASIEFRWKRAMQILSLTLCAVIGVLALIIGNGGASWADLWAIILIAVISGVLAPVARDLAAAVENWRS